MAVCKGRRRCISKATFKKMDRCHNKAVAAAHFAERRAERGKPSKAGGRAWSKAYDQTYSACMSGRKRR